MSYNICHCGNTCENHNFRHPFQEVTNVFFQDKHYVINASDFPVKTSTKCTAGDCVALPSLHDTLTLKHKYVPVEYTYREINFTLPIDSYCVVCNMMLKNHGKVMTHIFTVEMKILNKEEYDKLNVIHPEDEDIKITVKQL